MSDWHNHLKHLEEKHQVLNKKIDVMESTGVYGEDNIHQMKKQRLHLKDEIAKIKSEHNH
jgi:uncharacterized protein YdcH (DUF465 family)